jgi:hypothetical protein
MRLENGITRKYIVKVQESPLDSLVSASAMRMCLGLSTVSEDGVGAAPVDRLIDEPMLGLALKRDVADPLGAFRVYLLLQGTGDTEVDPIDEEAPLQTQTFKMISLKAKCLLSESETHVNLVAYCDYKKMLTYRLDSETALVLVSAISGSETGAASPSANAASGSFKTATVEHMRKVSNDEKEALQCAMALEWKSVLTAVESDDALPEPLSAREPEYWGQPASKLRRLQSEPLTPVRATSAHKARKA